MDVAVAYPMESGIPKKHILTGISDRIAVDFVSQWKSPRPHPLITTLWRSAAPAFVKRGVLGALCAWAHDDGTFPHPPTVRALTQHRYPDGRRLCERIVRYQLRLLEQLGVLVAPVGTWTRWHRREYRLQPAAVGQITLATIRAAQYAHNCERKAKQIAPLNGVAIKGAIKGATVRNQGGNGGPLTIKDLIKRKNKKEPPPPAESSEDVWTLILAHIQDHIPHWQFGKWWHPTRLVADYGRELRIAAHIGDVDISAYLQRHYAAELRAAADAVRPGVQIEFVTVNVNRLAS